MRSKLGVIFGLAFLLGFCSCSSAQRSTGNEHAEHADQVDAEAPQDAAAESTEPGVSIPSEANRHLGQGPQDCGASGEPPSLKMLPEFVTIFDHLTSECESLSARILLQNRGNESLRIEGLDLDHDAFSFELTEDLPLTIPPLSSVAIPIRHLSEGEGRSTGQLTVVTDRGCTEFEIGGLGVSGPLIGYSDLAIDFGSVDVDGHSAPQEVTILKQGMGDESVELSGFQAGPSEFQVISSPDGRVQPASCESVSIEVQFAPSQESASGATEGNLAWLLNIRGADGQESPGSMSIPLLGTVER